MNQWWNKSQSSVIQKLRSWRWTITEGFRNHGIYRVLFVGTETGFHHRFGSHSSIFGRQVLEEGKTIGRWTKILLLMCFWGEEDLIRCIPKVLWPCNQNNIRNISTSSQIENFFVSLKVFHRKSLHLKVEAPKCPRVGSTSARSPRRLNRFPSHQATKAAAGPAHSSKAAGSTKIAKKKKNFRKRFHPPKKRPKISGNWRWIL